MNSDRGYDVMGNGTLHTYCRHHHKYEALNIHNIVEGRPVQQCYFCPVLCLSIVLIMEGSN